MWKSSSANMDKYNYQTINIINNVFHVRLVNCQQSEQCKYVQ